jgi:hypothetical protein
MCEEQFSYIAVSSGLLIDGHGTWMTSKRGFLSYALEDWEIAERLFCDLERSGFKLWFDRRQFRPGGEVDTQVLNAIKESYFFIVLLTPISVSKDGYIRKEIALVFDMIDKLGMDQSFIVPVRVAECEPRSDEIGGLSHYIDLFPKWSEGINRLAPLLPTNGATPHIDGASPQEIQASLCDTSYILSVARGLRDRSAVAVFLDNCKRRLSAFDERVLSRKVLNVFRQMEDFSACIELHATIGCGAQDKDTRCTACGAQGTIIHGTIDFGGRSPMDYNDNYISLCVNCYWSYYYFEVDYNGTGPLNFDYGTNTYR